MNNAGSSVATQMLPSLTAPETLWTQAVCTDARNFIVECWSRLHEQDLKFLHVTNKGIFICPSLFLEYYIYFSEWLHSTFPSFPRSTLWQMLFVSLNSNYRLCSKSHETAVPLSSQICPGQCDFFRHDDEKLHRELVFCTEVDKSASRLVTPNFSNTAKM